MTTWMDAPVGGKDPARRAARRSRAMLVAVVLCISLAAVLALAGPVAALSQLRIDWSFAYVPGLAVLAFAAVMALTTYGRRG